MGEIWGIILAAGESKRIGSPKMLLPLRGKTMIELVICNVTASYVDNTLVVLGAHEEVLKNVISSYGVKTYINVNYKEGMLSSVQCGFRNLPSDFRAALVFQGDQPFITPAVINSVIDAYRSSGKGIVIPVHNKKRGHPLLLDSKYSVEIDRLDAGEGLRSLAYRFPDDVFEVETDNTGILRDFDTIEDYIKEKNQK
jgi:molybdenum cofactor cytidylyltransferase